MRRPALVAVIAVLLVLYSAPSAEASDVGSLSGSVTDSAGTPLSGVSVTAVKWWSSEPTSTVSSTDGSFTIDGLAAGDYQVCFTAANASGGRSTTRYLDRCWKDVDVDNGIVGSTATPVRIVAGATTSGIVQSLRAAGAVAGLVTDTDGHPVSRATVTVVAGPRSVFPGIRGRAVTTPDGSYRVDRLPPAEDYTVCVSASEAVGGSSDTGYLDQCYGHTQVQNGQPSGSATTFGVTSGATTSPPPIALDPAAQLSGELTTRSGKPIAGVKVVAEDQAGPARATDVTDASGRFLLSVDNDNGWSNGLYSGARLPVAPYRIFFNANQLPEYVSGYYKHIYSPGGSSWGAPTMVTPEAGTSTIIRDTLDDASSITGTVTDSAGTPLRDVRVLLSHEGRQEVTGRTDDTGGYRLDGLPEATYTVCFDADSATGGRSEAGYLDHCTGDTPVQHPEAISLRYAEHRSAANAALTSASRISGTVADPSRRGIFGARVIISQAGSEVDEVHADWDGVYTSRRLPAGRYTVCFDNTSTEPPTYAPECYDDVPRTGTPTPVITTAGGITKVDATLSVVPEPDTTAPTVRLTNPTRPFTNTTEVKATFTGTDAEGSIANYDVRYRSTAWNLTTYGGYRIPAGGLHNTTGSVTTTGSPGRTYCYSARARDEAGNVSRYTAERCVNVPLDDRALTASTGWRRNTNPDAYRGTETATGQIGATLRLKGANVTTIALVVTTCRTCGTAGLYLDGRQLTTVNTYSPDTHRRVIDVSPTVAARTGTITIKLLDRDRQLIVDGLAIAHS